MADEQHTALADVLAAVRAHAQAAVGIRRDAAPRLPVRTLQDPRDDVLETAEDGLALARRLAGPEALVLVDRIATPAADVHDGAKRTLAPCPTPSASPSSRATRPARSSSSRPCASST